MTSRRLTLVWCSLLLGLADSALPAAAARPAWVLRSDENAKILIDIQTRFFPEGASQFGVEGFDSEVRDLGPGFRDRLRQSVRQALTTLEARRAEEKDPAVRQDLGILIQSAQQSLEGSELGERLQIQYFDAPQTIFFGVRALLDDQIAPARRPAALTRLRRYTGLEAGRTPFLEQARDRLRERLDVLGLLGPSKEEVEKHIANSGFYVDGIGKLFAKYGIAGFEEPLARLKAQVAEYNDFLKKEVLPKARTDFRLPAELYAFSLRQFGVDVPPAALAERARVSFMEIRNEMKALAPLVAREKSFASLTIAT